jgi:methylphosphotriester-DNA--protein-cysteine methyltransferase
MEFEQRYLAMETRDESYAGEFFAAVTSTGIYCRPGCPAPTPKRENVRFYRSAEAARSNGFRACLRCHPDECS